MNWYLKTLRKYAAFNGRARRTEYWSFVVINVIISIALNFIDGSLHSHGALGVIYGLAVLIPGLAVAVRRLHDTDHSAWWLLFMFLPLVGQIVLLVLTTRKGDAGSNRYGIDPKLAG